MSDLLLVPLCKLLGDLPTREVDTVQLLSKGLGVDDCEVLDVDCEGLDVYESANSVLSANYIYHSQRVGRPQVKSGYAFCGEFPQDLK